MDIGNEAAELAIKAHSEFLKIDDGGDPENALWHLLYTLVDYAEAKNMNFSAVLEDVINERSAVVSSAAPKA